MAIIDWPTTRPFAGALFSLALDVKESTYTGFLTGNRTRRSNLADRMRGTLTLPPCMTPVDAAAREALLMGVRSTGDWLRLAMPHRRYPLGNFGGSPTVATTVAAGARSVVIGGVKARPNILLNGGFEIDSNADGVADGWTNYASGSVGTVTRYGLTGPLLAGEVGARIQAAQSSALNGALGFLSTAVPVVAGATYTATAAMQASAGASCVISIAWLGAGGVYISEASSSHDISLARRSCSGVAEAGALTAQVICYVYSTSGIALDFNVDNVQLEANAAASTYGGLAVAAAGDFLGVGGNLLMVAYAGATANDAGVMTVPLAVPLPKAISSGAAVTWNAPTGLWELDDDGLQLDYSAGLLQGGIAIPLRQVVA